MKKNVLNPTARLSIVSLLFGIMIFAAQTLTADTYHFPDSWGKAGFTIETTTPTTLVFNYSVEALELKTTQVNGETVNVIAMPGEVLSNAIGSPDLPAMAEYFEIPEGMEATYKVLSYQTETYPNVNLAPTPEVNGNSISYLKDQDIYSKNRFYPSEPIAVSDADQNMAMLMVTPFHYNPVIQQLVVYRDMKIEVSFHPADAEALPLSTNYEEPKAIKVKMTKRYSYEPNVNNYEQEDFITAQTQSSLKEMANDEVTIYPNPNNGSFTLNMKFENKDVVSIKLYNSMNEVVYEENNVNTELNFSKRINLRTLSKGIYYLRIMGSETESVSKIILQK
jgi:hypothetical protein